MQPDDKAALHAAARPGFFAVTRVRSLPVLLMPVFVGSSAAWAETGRFSWGWFVLVFASAVLGILAFNVLEDVIDNASGAEAAARADALSVPTGAALISEAFPRSRALRLGVVLLSLAALGAVALAVWRSPVVVIFGVSAFALAIGSSVPPLRYGSRGAGLAEAGAVMSGMFQTAGAYVAISGRLDLIGLRIGLVPGLLLALIVFHGAYLRYRSDITAGRPSTVSRLGAERAVAVSAVLIAVTFFTLAMQVVMHVWPLYSLVAVLGGFPMLLAYARLQGEIGPLQNYLTLFGGTLGSAALVGAMLTASLIVEGVLR